MDLNIIAHLFCNIVATFVVYRFFYIFLGSIVKNVKIEILGYITYYILSLICYFIIQIPIFMLVFNLFFFVVLSFNYQAGLKERILSVICIYSILFIIEMLIAAVTGYIHFPLNSQNMYSSIFGQVVNQLAGLVIVHIMASHEKIEKSNLPFIYWLCVLIIPIFSLYFLVLIFHMGNLSRINILLSGLFLLVINFSIMNLYELIVNAMNEQTNSLLLEQQNKFYKRQIDIMETSIKKNNALQHDLKGHLVTIKSYLRSNSVKSAIGYIDKMLKFDGNNPKESTKTGNSVVDSIFNLKVQEAIDKEIHINTKIQIPENLNVDSFDLTIILGNVLDNAIEAAVKIPSDRKIDITFIYNRGRLILNVENTYTGKIEIEKGTLISDKSDQFQHGIGLQNIYNAVDKYSGTVDINYDEKMFRIYIMMYV